MLVRFGNFIFHYRNFLFPIFYLALFIPSPNIFEQTEPALWLGSFIVILGVFTRCFTIGWVYIIRGGVNRQIYAEKLVTEGIYKICRNPMYLGNILLLLGFSIFANSLLFLLIFFPVFCLFYLAIIKAEENFLFGKFGEAFNQYRKETNALFPNILRLNSALKGHTFDFKRVIFKEYNSLFIYMGAIIALLKYQNQMEWNITLILIGILAPIYLFIKWIKKIMVTNK
jgi:protein-S-isoprenylcysteine O-methyltransferase Ste14